MEEYEIRPFGLSSDEFPPNRDFHSSNAAPLNPSQGRPTLNCAAYRRNGCNAPGKIEKTSGGRVMIQGVKGDKMVLEGCKRVRKKKC